MNNLILVVDDDNFMRMHLNELLTQAGYQVVEASNGLEALFGLEKGTFNYTYEAFISCIHPRDRDFVRRSHQQAIQNRVKYNIEFRVVLADGIIRFLASKGVVFGDASGVYACLPLLPCLSCLFPMPNARCPCLMTND